MGTVSANQTIVSVIGLVALTVALVTGHIGGDAFVAVTSAMLGNSLGYINGKKVGRGEVLTEVAGEVKKHLTSDPASMVIVTPTTEEKAQ